MKKYIMLLSALAVAGAFTSCSEDVIEPGNNGGAATESAELIKFGISKSATRTHYDTNNSLQMLWDNGDGMTIWCQETYGDEQKTTKRDAGYYETKASGQSAAIENKKDPLYWGKGDENQGWHQFYAGSTGNPNTVISDQYGRVWDNNIAQMKKDPTLAFNVVTCRYDLDQMLLPGGTQWQEFDTSGNATSSNVNLENLPASGVLCSMDQNYLVSAKRTKKAETVDFHFLPIMTILELKIKGDPNQDIYLSSIWLTVPAKNNVLKNVGTNSKGVRVGEFDFAINSGTLEDADYTLGTPVNVTTTKDYTFRFSFPRDFTAKYKYNNTNYEYTKMVRVPKGSSLTVAVTLPPMNNLDLKDLKISVKSAGFGTNDFAMSTSKTLAPGSKTVIELPDWVTRSYADLGQTSNGKRLLWGTCNMTSATSWVSGPTLYGDYWTYSNVPGKTATQDMRLPSKTEMEWLQPVGNYSYSVTKSNGQTVSGTEKRGIVYKTIDGVTFTGAKDAMQPTSSDNCEQAWVYFSKHNTSGYIDANGTAKAQDNQTTVTPVGGYLVTSIKTGNAIFIPAAGYTTGGSSTSTKNNNENCNLWTSTANGSSDAYYLAADRRDWVQTNSGAKTWPVYKKFIVESESQSGTRTARLVKEVQ